MSEGVLPAPAYEAGQYVICRSGGVWRVSESDVGTVLLVEHESGAEKTLPAGSEEIVRAIASRETILEAIERVAYIRTIEAPNAKARMRLYDEAMRKYDEIEWIKIIKTVYLRQREKRLMPNEIAYAGKAKGYFHGEISVLLEMPLQKVEQHIGSVI
ncbi:MAG: hypothetical protein LBT65_01685 [Synergistaceae bacterium]|jgi:CarD family transcriptional regulator|nr:hypothetical protein [Synergistaceae bacterium]